MAKAYIVLATTGRSADNRTGQAEVPTVARYDGDGASTWIKGQLLKLSSGVIAAVAGSAQVVDTTDIPADTELFIALEDQAAVTSDKVSVQKVNSDMVFEAVLAYSDAGGTVIPTAPVSIIDTRYGLYEDASGNWAVDKFTTGTPVVVITDVESRYRPWKNDSLFVNSASERYNFVKFTFLSALIDN